MALVSFSLPTMEIASGKEPVAIFFMPGRKLKVHALKMYNDYFIIESKKTRGIYQATGQPWFYEKTPVFFFDYRNGKPMDPVLVHEVVQFAKKNKLNKVRRRDVRQGELLRRLQVVHKDKQTAQDQAEIHGNQYHDKVEASVGEFFDMINTQNKAAEEQHKPLDYTAEDYAFSLTVYLKDKGLLSSEECMLLEEKIRGGSLTFEQLVEDLKTKDFITIREPISIEAQNFLDDFHTYDPSRMSAFVDTLKKIDKGLKTMTSIPVKNWIPASLVLAISIGIIIGVMVLIQNWDMISKGISHILPPTAPIVPAKMVLGIKSLIMTKLNLW